MAERFDQEQNLNWNREPGIVVVPGSNYAKEMARWEQFPSKYGAPGNPYVFREYPRMVYRAELWQGKPVCMAAVADPSEFPNVNEFNRMEEQARKFSERCQRIVQDERELQAAMESGWRTSPDEAVEYLQNKLRETANAAAVRNYEDRNMSEAAKAEAKAAVDEAGLHIGEIPEKKRRGRPPKSA